MTDKKPSKAKAIKSQFSAEAIAAGGGVLGLITLFLLIYQNYLMSDQTAEMIATNKEMIYQRQMQEKERYNHLIEILYDSNENKPAFKSSYKREIKEARFNTKLRTEAFHEAAEYLKRVDRELDFSGGLLGHKIDFRKAEYTKLNCSGADLRDTNLNGVKLSNSNFHGCDFYGANLSKSDLSNSQLSNSILYNTLLDKAKLKNTDLRKAVFRKASVKNTDLSGADLRGAVFINVDLSSVNLTGAKYDGTTQWPENFDLIATDLKFKMTLDKSK